MEYRNLGRSGLQVSEICLGTMQFGWSADEPTSVTVLDAFTHAGGNFIDTANVYTGWVKESWLGHSEEILGRWMKKSDGLRRRLVMATKCKARMWDGPDGEGLSHRHIIRACEDSLRRLQTDYIDLYQFHGVDFHTPIEESMRAMDSLVRAGKVLHIGTSNFSAWRIMQALWQCDKAGLASFISYQPQYSIMERSGFEIEHSGLCKRFGIGVIPYSPLAAGFLTGKYRRGGPPVHSARSEGVKKYFNDRGWTILDTLEAIGRSHGKTIAQTALAWQLTNPVITAPIVGANNVGQLSDLLGAAGYRLSEAEMGRINEVSSFTREWWRANPE
ncbi:MAG: aldo/keto reductase [Candidatus Methylacidiphilales bacterium]|nr:aldo/keto reductase [Candidatus Methylacidiphilales bacterium]